MNNKLKLKIASTLVNTNAVLPVLECALLDGDRMITTDLQVWVNIPFHSHIKAAVPISKLMDAYGSLSNINMLVSPTDPSKLNINGVEGTISVTTEPFDNFPVTPFQMENWIGLLDALSVHHMVEATRFLSNDDLRPSMTYLFVHDQIVATDAHRLYYRDTPALTEAVLIDRKVINIMKAVGKGSWAVYRSVGTNGVYYTFANTSMDIYIGQRVADCVFPDYKRVMLDPKEYTGKITVDAKEFAAAIRTAMKFANRSTHQIVLEVTKQNQVLLGSADLDFTESFSGSVRARTSGNPIKLAFNGRLMLQYIERVAVTQGVTIEYTSPYKGIVVNGEYLLMLLLLNQ